MGEFEDIIYEISDRVATISLNRPDRLNALSPAMRRELLDAVVTADGDPDVGAMIVTGLGRGFCSGGDMKAMNDAGGAGRTAGTDTEAKHAALNEKIAPVRDRVVLAMRNATKPVIAAINGPAAGAGMNIALACDIRIASTVASFGQTFSRRGLHPDWGGTYFLPQIVGTAKAAELVWSGKMIDSAEALRLGIVSELVEPDDLMATATDMATSFASGPPIAIRLAKQSIYKSLNSSLEEALEYETFAQNICAATADSREGIAAFVEKRQPKFTGS